MTLLQAATHRITPRILFLALADTAVLFILGWLWFYIPDSHAWQVAFSVLFGAAVIAAILVLYATLIHRLTDTSTKPIWRGVLVLAGWLLLGRVLQHIAGKLGNNIEQRAGYWNSQLSPHHRIWFPYERLIHLQQLALQALLWIVIPALLLPFAVATVERLAKPWSAACATLLRPQHWLTVALAYVLGTMMADHLLAWHPTYSVHGEVLSVILRTLLVYVLAVVLLLLVLAVEAELLAREHTRRNPVV